MKKLLISLLTVCLICGIAITCACDLNSTPDSNSTSDNKLTYGKKYYSSSSFEDYETYKHYYVFNKDGTGTYSSRYTSAVTVGTDNIRDTDTGYLIKFDYVITEDRVVCTFNSEIKSYNDRHCGSNWYSVFEFSEDFLIIQGQYGESVYFCEDYLKTVPNFGK